MEKDKIKELATLYGISERSVTNYELKAAACGVAVPWDDARGLLVWYEDQHGRKPPKKLREKVAAMPGAAEEVIAVTETTEIQRDRLQVLEELCEMFGLAGTTARVVEEEERAYERYEASKATGLGEDLARRAWLASTEAKRAIHKTDDALQLALGLLKEWVRHEWAPEWRKIRDELSGSRLGLELRRELLGADEVEWVKVWNKGIESVLVKIETDRGEFENGR